MFPCFIASGSVTPLRDRRQMSLGAGGADGGLEAGAAGSLKPVPEPEPVPRAFNLKVANGIPLLCRVLHLLQHAVPA